MLASYCRKTYTITECKVCVSLKPLNREVLDFFDVAFFVLMKILDLYTGYLISQNKYATSTGLSSLLEGSISHDKITRFLNREELSCLLYTSPSPRD